MSRPTRFLRKTAIALALALSSAAPLAMGADPQNPFDPPAVGGGAGTRPNDVAAPPTPYSGTFRDEKMTLTLQYIGTIPEARAYRGTIVFGGKNYDAFANADAQQRLKGRFLVDDKPFPFTASIENGTLVFTTGATTYRLTAAGGGPAPAPLEGPGAKPAAPRPGGVGLAIRMMEDNTLRVMGVKPGGPAEKAGLREGDVILTIAGKDATSFKDPTEPIRGPENTTVALTILRGGQRVETTLTREPMELPPNRPEAPRDPNAGGAPAPATKAGVGINLNVTRDGAVVIEGLHPDGPAARAGLRPGDRILAIDGQAIRSVQDLSALPGEPGSPISLTVGRGNQTGKFDLKREVTNANPGGAAPADPNRPQPPAAENTGGVGLDIDVAADGNITITAARQGGPAAIGGVQAGDLLVAIDGRPIRDVSDLSQRLPGPVGSPIKLTVRRGAQTLDFDLRRAPR